MLNSQCSILIRSGCRITKRSSDARQDRTIDKTFQGRHVANQSCGEAPLEPQTMPRHAERKVVRILFTRCGSCKKNLMKRRSGSAVFSPKTRNSAESLRLQLLASGPPASRSWYIAFGDLPELALAGSPTP